MDFENILENVSSAFDVRYVDPIFRFEENKGSVECDVPVLKRNSHVEVREPFFSIPESFRGNRAALEGFFAHETAELFNATKSPLARFYLGRMEFVEKGNKWLLIPRLFTLYPTSALRLWYEYRADQLAGDKGYAAQILEIRRHIPLQVKFPPVTLTFRYE